MVSRVARPDSIVGSWGGGGGGWGRKPGVKMLEPKNISPPFEPYVFQDKGTGPTGPLPSPGERGVL